MKLTGCALDPLLCAALAGPAHSENGAYAYLLSVTPKARAAMLGNVVGHGCMNYTGPRSFVCTR